MIRRYNLSHPAGQPMPEDWIHLPDSVVAAADYDALVVRLAEVERLLLVARDCLRTAHNGWAETLGREIDAFLVPDVTCATHGCTYRDGRCIRCWGRDAHSKAIDSLLDDCATVYGGPVQHDSCCLDYPRCDCNSPSEPDNEWHCSQYPGCECFAGCREKALEGQREPHYARVMCREDLPVSAEAGIVADLYNELLYAVESKYPGESRHDTALRYIRDRETRPHHGPSQTVEPKP
jgi:hypothetical protein